VHCATHRVDALDVLPRQALDLVGQRLHVVRTSERVGSIGDAAFVADDLLRAQRDARGLLRRQAERLVETVGVQALRAAHDCGHALHRDTHHVVERLLRGERGPAGLRVESHQMTGRVLGAESLRHDSVPHAPAGAELGDFFEEVVVAVPEK